MWISEYHSPHRHLLLVPNYESPWLKVLISTLHFSQVIYFNSTLYLTQLIPIYLNLLISSYYILKYVSSLKEYIFWSSNTAGSSPCRDAARFRTAGADA